jgi:hypothetical protein
MNAALFDKLKKLCKMRYISKQCNIKTVYIPQDKVDAFAMMLESPYDKHSDFIRHKAWMLWQIDCQFDN